MAGAVERSTSPLDGLGKLAAGGHASPLVFQAPAASWIRSTMWSPSELAKIAGDVRTAFRIWPLASGFLWETDCPSIEASLAQFADWLDRGCGKRASIPRSNPLHHYPYGDVCLYAGYKEMAEMFGSRSPVFDAVDWDFAGLPGRNASRSVFWMGTVGAYTPCHYDTYGYNIVTQLHGRKRWTLFSPADSSCLYPTRIPYEESSVFSAVDIKQPDFGKHPLFASARKYEVVLEAGDVLYVPSHWWHHVESLDTSVSVNTWVELESDRVDRVGEAVARTLVTALKAQSLSPREEWLNPTETAESHQGNLQLLRMALLCSTGDGTKPEETVADLPPKGHECDQQPFQSPPAKRVYHGPDASQREDGGVPRTPDSPEAIEPNNEEEASVSLETALLNAILSPDCLRHITSKLMNAVPQPRRI